ncbi:MAG: hypothetical protein HC842_09175 [Cytophagales bacterium]|nr:hypothetical protein [Cytophagales bacterium]
MNHVMRSLALGLLMAHTAMAQTGNLKKVKITEQISMDLPGELIPMPEGEVRKKLVATRPPLAAYTDMGNHQATIWW